MYIGMCLHVSACVCMCMCLLVPACVLVHVSVSQGLTQAKQVLFL